MSQTVSLDYVLWDEINDEFLRSSEKVGKRYVDVLRVHVSAFYDCPYGRAYRTEYALSKARDYLWFDN